MGPFDRRHCAQTEILQEVLEVTKPSIFVTVNPKSNYAKLMFATLLTRFLVFRVILRSTWSKAKSKAGNPR